MLFRPPHGKLSLVTFAHIWWRGRTLAFWTIDPRDYAQKNPIDVAQYVGERLAPGGVVLLHDGVANREPGSGEFVTAKALDDILAAAATKSIPLVPLGQALHRTRH